jgi:hypothetical protein
VSGEGGGAEKGGASLVREIHEASSSSGASSASSAGGVGGVVKHQPVTFNPHGGSVLSLKVSVCT